MALDSRQLHRQKLHKKNCRSNSGSAFGAISGKLKG